MQSGPRERTGSSRRWWVVQLVSRLGMGSLVRVKAPKGEDGSDPPPSRPWWSLLPQHDVRVVVVEPGREHGRLALESELGPVLHGQRPEEHQPVRRAATTRVRLRPLLLLLQVWVLVA